MSDVLSYLSLAAVSVLCMWSVYRIFTHILQRLDQTPQTHFSVKDLKKDPMLSLEKLFKEDYLLHNQQLFDDEPKKSQENLEETLDLLRFLWEDDVRPSEAIELLQLPVAIVCAKYRLWNAGEKYES